MHPYNVRDLVERCTCPTQFPMIRVSEGKYRIGDTKVLIFVRILRSHVMVRVGGGWDTLSHYLDKHDPCRCRTSHRSMISAKLIQKAGGSFDLGSAQVHYERSPPRTRRSSASSVGSCAGTTLQNQQSAAAAAAATAAAATVTAATATAATTGTLGQLHAPRSVSNNRSRSPTPQQTNKHHQHYHHHHQHQHQHQHQHHHHQQQQQQLGGEDQQKKINRSRSPTPQRKFFNSPSHHQQQVTTTNITTTTTTTPDSGKQRSRSPTPKVTLGSRSPTPKVDHHQQHVKIPSSVVDSPKKIFNDDTRAHINQTKHSLSDPKRELHQEIKAKVPLSEEFAKRYVVDGGVARRAVEREDTPKYEPTIYNYKCREDSNSRSPTPSPPAIKEEPALESFTKDTTNAVVTTSNVNYAKSLHGDGEHSDNCSEVSDEGYRSLGAVQPPTANGNSALNAQQSSSSSSSPTVVDSQKQPTKTEQEERSCVETESIETGLRKIRIGPGSPLRASPARSVASSSGDRTPRAGSVIRENSNVSRASSGSRTPRESNSSPEGSPLKRTINIRNSLRKPPTGSLSKASVLPKSNQLSTTGSNTWNGRQARQRPSLQSDTFLNPQGSSTCATTPNFTRKSTVRQSLPRPASNGGGSQYDRNGRRIKQSTTGSLQSSPTKVANPLLEQILQKVGHLRDDREVVQKLQDLLRDYQVNSHGDNDPTLEFTRAWIDGNGTVVLPQDSQMVASPRKDPKAASERGSFSRIPAPIYKRPMSVASDSV
ncbi:hypothetical protein M0802_010014 [Mischocyttarus mexicanus]|nr:hypothetical protein M0802_010014 [Mischocyttarus mexicanus]